MGSSNQDWSPRLGHGGKEVPPWAHPIVLPGGGAKGPAAAVSVDPMQRTRRITGPAPVARTTEEVSALDRSIIEQLQEDGRKAFTQIATELGISEAAVRQRTNRLIKRGVLQIVGVADPLKLGYDQMALIGVRCQGDMMLEAADAISELPEVIYVVATAGAYDLLVEAVCVDSEALLEFLATRLRKVPGVLSTETFVYLRIVKQSFHWRTA